jgi:agmatinase
MRIVSMSPIEELAKLLRPAGGGIYTVSTGTKDQLRIQRRIYGAERDEDVKARWLASLSRIAEARVVLLGVPSDVGAGFMRGASFGPQSLRRELLRRDSFLYRDERIVDAGDVFVVPQLLHDSMLSADQLAASRAAVHGAAESSLPVSPLSIAERALDLIRALAPDARPLVLGGDHSVGWPVAASLARGRAAEMGILHFDAHTDLLEHRLGVKYCFATWAYHANDLVGRTGRLQQVGIRISRRTREYWEKELGVRQYWMAEMSSRSAKDVAAEIIGAFSAAGVRGVYVSNDIDGTDPLYGQATGTPEPGGLHPDTVSSIIREVASAFPIWGSDLVEVAPQVGNHVPREPATTLGTASHYLELQARVMMER